MRTAIFVDLGQIPGLLKLQDEVELRTIHCPDLESALATIAESSPHVVVANAALELEFPGGFLASIRGRVIGFRAPVIMANISTPPQSLTIYEWDSGSRDYGSRTSQPKDLGLEIGRFCRRAVGIWTNSEEVRAIGFADNVECEDASLHIQTEILARDSIKIKTTILNGGAVVEKVTNPFDPASDDAVAELTLAAKAQHDRVVEKLTMGEYDRD